MSFYSEFLIYMSIISIFDHKIICKQNSWATQMQVGQPKVELGLPDGRPSQKVKFKHCMQHKRARNVSVALLTPKTYI